MVAKAQYDELKIIEGTLLRAGVACGDRVLALLARTFGDWGQSTAHFEDVMFFCRNAGYRPELAWTCCDYADTLRERDGTGHKVEAGALLDESPSISSELGMRLLMERVLSRREILGA